MAILFAVYEDISENRFLFGQNSKDKPSYINVYIYYYSFS